MYLLLLKVPEGLVFKYFGSINLLSIGILIKFFKVSLVMSC